LWFNQFLTSDIKAYDSLDLQFDLVNNDRLGLVPLDRFRIRHAMRERELHGDN